MGKLLNRLAEKKLLVSDGAWGTMLHAAGLTNGAPPEEWNASHPDAVRAVAAAYAGVGCDLVLSNTFGGSRLMLQQHGLGDRVAELNAKGAQLSLEGASQAIVAASVGPTGAFCEPLGEVSVEQMEAVFLEQISAIFSTGVSAVCIETMCALDESCCAIRAAKKANPASDVICTMTFNATPAGPRTMMGVSPAQAAAELTAAGADVVGANCGNGVEQMIAIAAEFRKATHLPILIHANAGLPDLIEGKAVFRQTPQQMASRVKDLVSACATIIGGCCGTTPEHIAAIKREVDRIRTSL